MYLLLFGYNELSKKKTKKNIKLDFVSWKIVHGLYNKQNFPECICVGTAW